MKAGDSPFVDVVTTGGGLELLFEARGKIDELQAFVARWGEENGVAVGDEMTDDVKRRLAAAMTDFILYR